MMFFGVVFVLYFLHLSAGKDKTRQDICYYNIASTISWHAVSRKTLVEACQIYSITNQILKIISKKQRKRKKRRSMCNKF